MASLVKLSERWNERRRVRQARELSIVDRGDKRGVEVREGDGRAPLCFLCDAGSFWPGQGSDRMADKISRG